MISPHSLLLPTTRLAIEAGELALGYYRPGAQTVAQVERKAGGSPVTEADHAVDQFLADRLRILLPQAGWLSEETLDTPDRLNNELVFIVDPIDGTRAFMAGDPRWGISIALVQAGRPLWGVLYMPALDETYSACAGLGATCNGSPIHVTNRRELAGGRIAGPEPLLANMRHRGLTFETEPKIPSLAYRMARVASGSLDAGIASTNACDWDIAAVDLILHEAGGTLTDLHGRRPTYNAPVPRHDVLIGTSVQLHEEMTSSLRMAHELH